GGIQKGQKVQKRQKGQEFLSFLLSLPFLYSNFISVEEPCFVKVSRHQLVLLFSPVSFSLFLFIRRHQMLHFADAVLPSSEKA
ncbi:MAG: hypothetical protein L0226_04760, partial [Acidobacteria bacterium]|nr:hypothetical protein [Acidobacteriota bacterium]MCI0697494.1 hypothetical protein [candidate division KSB1 bacterium]